MRAIGEFLPRLLHGGDGLVVAFRFDLHIGEEEVITRFARIQHQGLFVVLDGFIDLPRLLIKLTQVFKQITPHPRRRLFCQLFKQRNRLRGSLILNQRSDMLFPEVLRGLVLRRLVELDRPRIKIEGLTVIPSEGEEIANPG